MARQWLHHNYSNYLFYKFNIRPHTIIDVGLYDYTYAERYKDMCEVVYAYEPNKTLFNKIRKHHKLQKWESYKNYIFLNDIAITNFVGITKFNEDLENAGCSSLLDNIPDNHDFTSYDVNCSTIDKEFINYNYKIDYLKIDTEWNDIFVLEGAKEVIDKHKPIIQVHHYEKGMDKIFDNLNYVKVKTPDDFYKFYFLPKSILTLKQKISILTNKEVQV